MSTIGNSPSSSSSNSSSMTDARMDVKAEIMNSQRAVPCRTIDGKMKDVKECLMAQWGFYRQMYVYLQLKDINPVTVVPLEMTQEILERIVDWCENHSGVKEPVIDKEKITEVRVCYDLNEFEKTFLNVQIEDLMELVNAANFLDLRSLYQRSTQHLASLMKNKSPKELRELFGFEDDLTTKEIKEMKKSNVWCNTDSKAT